MKFNALILTIISFSWFVIPVKAFAFGVNNSLNNLPQMTVVIDAGHGGHDQGCSGDHDHAIEKHLALKLSLEYGSIIEDLFPNVKIIYTRTTDTFIPLNQRAAIANESSADLFISLHCNAIANAKVSGTETFVMGLHKSEENLEVAKRENASILLENDYATTYEGYDPNTPEGHIIMSLFQNAYLNESLEFAQIIENSFGESQKIKSRGVKQAGFVVLRKTTMPSVLIETGFLTNDYDRDLLLSNEGQKEVIASLVKAFKEYYHIWMERQTDKQYFKSNVSVDISTRAQPIDSNKVTHLKEASPSITVSDQETVSIQPDKPSVKKVYKIQLAATLKEIEVKGKWANIPVLEVRKEGDYYKYMTGHFESRTDAKTLQKQLISEGFAGAFIIGN